MEAEFMAQTIVIGSMEVKEQNRMKNNKLPLNNTIRLPPKLNYKYLEQIESSKSCQVSYLSCQTSSLIFSFVDQCLR